MRHPVGRKKSQKRIRNLTLLLATSEYLQGLMCQQFSTYLFLFLGLCKTNQECIKLRDCPYTKNLLTRVLSSSDRAEKNNMISEMRKLVCKPSDRSVCCDIEESEAEAEAEGNYEESEAEAEGDHEESEAEAEGDHEDSEAEAEGDHEDSEAEAEGDHEEANPEAEGDHEESEAEAEGSSHDDQNEISDTLGK